ncbi:MAG TPA: AMP-binding protein [Acidimicrobiia bacterium]|nr:AMP-binding protein [Acidimicrobiia bacterium]
MLDWLRRHDPARVFIETPDVTLTFGEIADAVMDRPVHDIEVVRPRLDIQSVIDLLAVMSKGSAVVTGNVETAAIDPSDAASVLFTSGTSGRPKGVRLTIHNWEAAANASMQHLGHGTADTWLLALPLHHVAGLSILMRSAYAGGAVRMLPGFDPVAFATHLRRGVSVASMVPTMLSRVLDVDPGPYDGLKAVLLGGGPIPDRVLDRAGAAGLPVLPTYGLTETAGQVATLKPEAPLENKAHPLPGVDIRIDPDERIAVRGPMLSPGYVGEPDRGSEDWLVTGDLGTIDDDGALRVTGRADTIIVSGGENIDPAVVEATLLRVEGVQEALVAGLTSEEWGMEAVCLYVGQANPAQVETALRQILPVFMIPKRWRQVAGLPMTPMGKPDRDEAARLFI